MRILLTNDDGYNSKGIIILEEVLKSYGHKISVCAPSTQRSATSQAISIHSSVSITSYAKDHYHCSGTPADCLLYGFISGLFSVNDFDLVVSGINHGLNISSDILYSGTVGAAKEGALVGLKSIAISAEASANMDDCNYREAAIFLAENLDIFYPFCTLNSIVNINVPLKIEGSWLAGCPGFLDYKDATEVVIGAVKDIQQIINKNSTVKLSLKSINEEIPTLAQYDYKSKTDYEIIRNNRISVTVLEVKAAISPLQKKLIQLEESE